MPNFPGKSFYQNDSYDIYLDQQGWQIAILSPLPTYFSYNCPKCGVSLRFGKTVTATTTFCNTCNKG